MMAHHIDDIKVSKKEKEKGRATLPSLLRYNLETHTSLMLTAHVSVTKPVTRLHVAAWEAW